GWIRSSGSTGRRGKAGWSPATWCCCWRPARDTRGPRPASVGEEGRPMPITTTTVETSRLRTFVRQAGEPGKPLVLLLHGNVSSSVFFEHLMEALAADFHVVAPDYRGFGG